MVLPAEIPTIGGTELFVVVSFVAVVSAIWVFIDARRRGMHHAPLWAASVGFLFLFYALPGLAALIVYLALRDTQTGDAESSGESGSTL